MRSALRQTKGRRLRRIARAVPAICPIGGWNARDALASMPSEDAIELINWFPRQNDVVARRGYTEHCDTESGGAVETLIPYHYGATKKLFAVSGGQIWDTDTDNTSVHTGLTVNTVSFATLNGKMTLCNGADDPVSFDGSTFASHGWTDASSTLDFTKLVYAFTFKSRMYFVEKGTQTFWYGDTLAISGPLLKFDVGAVIGVEGEISFITSIQNDGGDGKDDLFVLVYSSGAVIVYQGSNPGGGDWNHVGTYKIGAPLSRFAHTSNGDDVLVVTSRGYEQLVRSTREGEGVKLRSLVSDKIQQEVTARIRQSGYNDSWQLVVYNRSQMLIVQAPVSSASARHHVRNINTGAWTRFTLPAARSWCILDKLCYMGGRDGKVYLFDSESNTDAGTAIKLDATMAWHAMRNPSVSKTLQMLKLNFKGYFFPTIRVSVAGDYAEHKRWTQLNIGSQSSLSEWNQVEWNAAQWAVGAETREFQHQHNADGFVLSLRVQCYGQQGQFAWNGHTYIVTDGGLL